MWRAFFRPLLEQDIYAFLERQLDWRVRWEAPRLRDIMLKPAGLFTGKASAPLPELENPTFVSFLDLARWTSAWIVFLGHLRDPLFLGYESLSPGDRPLLVKAWYFVTGWFGAAVIVFFVLSGYLVGGVACARARHGRFVPVDYAIDRFSRIFLPFAPALLLTVLLDLAGAALFGDLGLYSHAHPMIREKIASEPFENYLTLENLVLNSLMLQTIVARPLGSNQPLWTISLEFWFYVVFGLGLASALAGAAFRRAAGLIVSALLVAALGQDFVTYSGLWLIGASIAFVPASMMERPIKALIVFLCVLVVVRLAQGVVVRDGLVVARNYLIAFSFAWLLLSMRGARLSLLDRLSEFNAFFASFSYSLYLIHFPLMLFLLGALYASGGFDGVAHGYSATDGRGLFAYALVAFAVGVCAWAFSQLTERRTQCLRTVLRRQFAQKSHFKTVC